MLFAGYSFAGPWYIVEVETSGELRSFLDICALTFLVAFNEFIKLISLKVTMRTNN